VEKQGPPVATNRETRYDILMFQSARSLLLVFSLVAVSACASPQVTDTDTYSERSRLGDTRAQIEADRRAEEQRAAIATITTTPPPAAPANVAAPPAAPAAVESTRAAPPQSAAAPAAPAAAPAAAVAPKPQSLPAAETAPRLDPAAMDRALDQLRELGALRDSGVLTDDEFERLKARILDGQL
jgi:hypothetical protein